MSTDKCCWAEVLSDRMETRMLGTRGSGLWEYFHWSQWWVRCPNQVWAGHQATAHGAKNNLWALITREWVKGTTLETLRRRLIILAEACRPSLYYIAADGALSGLKGASSLSTTITSDWVENETGVANAGTLSSSRVSSGTRAVSGSMMGGGVLVRRMGKSR